MDGEIVTGASVPFNGGESLVHDAAIIADGATIAEGAGVGPGAFVGERVRLGDGVRVGPNATVLAGVRVGMGAEVTPGSVVAADVPPYAIAQGNPARIVGYRASQRFDVERRLRASTIPDEDFPVHFGQATLFRHPEVVDLRGRLTFDEVGAQLPFTPVRYFLVYGVPGREVRGEHAHRKMHEVVVCTYGECTVMVNDGNERAEVILDRRDVSLSIPPMTWTSQYQYSPDAVLLALCSEPYEADDYIRTYDEFLELTGSD